MYLGNNNPNLFSKPAKVTVASLYPPMCSGFNDSMLDAFMPASICEPSGFLELKQKRNSVVLFCFYALNQFPRWLSVCLLRFLTCHQNRYRTNAAAIRMRRASRQTGATSGKLELKYMKRDLEASCIKTLRDNIKCNNLLIPSRKLSVLLPCRF